MAVTMEVPLSRPDVGEAEIEAVLAVLRTPFLSMGERVVQFERAVAEYVGARHAIAVNSGTSGLHVLVCSLGIGEGDEVITTPFSFIASSNCILYERAVPVFVDIEPRTLNIDPDLIEARIGPRTKAVLPVDAFGQPGRLDEIKRIADRHGLPVLEDACESLGSEYRGIRAGSGSFCDGAVFAFYPNKQITTGEGGIIVTDREDIARLCRSLRNQGRGEANVWLSHERLGYNYRMDEMSAALGLAQMQRIDQIVGERQRVAEMYSERLGKVSGVEVPYVSPDVGMSWFVYVIRVDRSVDRDGVMAHLRQSGIGCRPYFTPIHLQPFYREMFGYRGGGFPVTEDAARRVIALPFFNKLASEQVDYVVEKLREGIELYHRM